MAKKNECQRQKECYFLFYSLNKCLSFWNHMEQMRVKLYHSLFSCYLTGVLRHSLGVNSCSGNPNDDKNSAYYQPRCTDKMLFQ